MITFRRPTEERIAAYRNDRLTVAPPCVPADRPPHGFHHDRCTRQIGQGRADFERARVGLRQWEAHQRAGVEIFPGNVAVAASETVAIVTRQLGLWVLAACRVTNVIDEPTVFGFTYATLPDHPECGYESFTVRLEASDVQFEIEAVSKPGIPLVQLAAPVTRRLQQRATNAYLTALATWTNQTS